MSKLILPANSWVQPYPFGQSCILLAEDISLKLRDDRRTFLAFVPPDAHIPPGQLVRLNTPAGPKPKGRMFLVPIQTAVVLVPVNTVTLVATRIEDIGARLAITLVGAAPT